MDFHHRMVLLIALEGEGSMRVDSQTIPIRPNQALLIFPFQYHSYLSMPPSLLWFYVTFTLEPTDRYERLRFHPVPLSPFMKRLCHQIAVLYHKAQSECDHPPALVFLLAAFLEEMLRTGNLPPSPPRKFHISKKHRIVQAACRLIYERLSHPPSTPNLAKTLSISPTSLRSFFKEITGLSIGSFLTRVRLCEAAALLHGTPLEIKEVAQRVGYLSVSSFIRSFRQMARITPLQFRKSGADPSALKPFLTYPEDR